MDNNILSAVCAEFLKAIQAAFPATVIYDSYYQLDHLATTDAAWYAVGDDAPDAVRLCRCAKIAGVFCLTHESVLELADPSLFSKIAEILAYDY